MSHFCVIVVGDNVAEQLAPYHDFECTGVDDQYVVDVDVTADVQKAIDERGFEDGLDYHGLTERQVASEAELDRADKHKYHYAIVRDGKLVKAVDRTNPNKKWDWYVEGGRWSGYFLLKSGAHADSATCQEIDFKGMRDAAALKAQERYERARAVLGDAPRPTSWDDIRTKHTTGEQTDYDAARNEYGSQAAVERISKDRELFWCAPAELQAFYEPIERYIDDARRRAIAPYAVLKAGKWYAKGEMGWFGVSHDTAEQSDWNRQVDALLEGLSPDTRLTIIDCHI